MSLQNKAWDVIKVNFPITNYYWDEQKFKKIYSGALESFTLKDVNLILSNIGVTNKDNWVK